VEDKVVEEIVVEVKAETTEKDATVTAEPEN
jgi:hypothetical protein